MMESQKRILSSSPEPGRSAWVLQGLTSAIPPTGLIALFTVTCSRPLSKKTLGYLDGYSLGQWICDYLICCCFFPPINF